MEIAYALKTNHINKKKIAVHDLNQIIQFPNAIKTNCANTFSITIRGNLMPEAGIQDGDTILLEKTYTLENGAIMLFKGEDQIIMKRIKIIAGRACWEDGDRNPIEIDTAKYEVQGKLIKVLRK